MKNLYFPIFLFTLLSLAITNLVAPDLLLIKISMIITLLIALSCFFLKCFKTSWIIISISFGLLFSVYFINTKNNYNHISKIAIPDKPYLTVTGKLLSYPIIKKNSSILFIKTLSFEYQKKTFLQPLRIRLKVMGNLQHLYQGDLVRINCKIYKPNFQVNFFRSPYENYFLYKIIHFNGYCKSSQMVQKLKGGNIFFNFIGNWRNKIRNKIESYYQSTGSQVLKSEGVFLQAILLGDRGKISPGFKERLLNGGIFHLIAISGAHIGIITIFCLFSFKLLRVNYKFSHLITGFILLLFLIISGFQVSASRAVLVALLIIAARLNYLDYSSINLISVSGLIILFLNPFQFLDPGFILTFSLALAIVWGRNFFIPLFKNFIPKLREYISANLSASMIALPLSFYYFKSYSILAPVCSFLLVPVMAIITALGLLIILSAPFFDFLSTTFLWLLQFPFFLFFHILKLIESLSFLRIYNVSPTLFLVISMFFLFYSLGKVRKPFKKIFLISLFMICSLFCVIRFFKYIPQELEIYFLDVGQGDSSVVVFKNGDGLLIDGGGLYQSDYEIGKQIVLPFILQKRINIKWFAISHYHPDHVPGLIELISLLKPEEIWISSIAYQNNLYRELLSKCDQFPKVKIKHICSSFKKNILTTTITCVYPPEIIISPETHNNYSQVLKISNQNIKIMFTGDLENETEKYLLKNNRSELDCQILKVPHHGSKSSSSLEFIKAVNPKLAIISYKKNNYFNFPHQRVLHNYLRQNVKILSTAKNGGIRISHDKLGKITVQTSK